jgi:hypothetical protein
VPIPIQHRGHQKIDGAESNDQRCRRHDERDNAQPLGFEHLESKRVLELRRKTSPMLSTPEIAARFHPISLRPTAPVHQLVRPGSFSAILFYEALCLTSRFAQPVSRSTQLCITAKLIVEWYRWVIRVTPAK